MSLGPLGPSPLVRSARDDDVLTRSMADGKLCRMFSGHGLRGFLKSQQLAWKASYGRILRFHRHHGRWPNLLRPQTFNEKILYRSIYDRWELFHVLSDKLAVRNYVRERVGDAVAIPKVLFLTRSPELLLTVPLPRYFVMKSNHGQGHTYLHGCDDVEVDRRRLAVLGKIDSSPFARRVEEAMLKLAGGGGAEVKLPAEIVDRAETALPIEQAHESALAKSIKTGAERRVETGLLARIVARLRALT